MQAITNSSNAASGRAQFQVLSARRDARQAEQTARTIEQQAQAAQRSADQEQARADSLSSQAADANGRSDLARQNLASLESGLQGGRLAGGAGRGSGRMVDTYA